MDPGTAYYEPISGQYITVDSFGDATTVYPSQVPDFSDVQYASVLNPRPSQYPRHRHYGWGDHTPTAGGDPSGERGFAYSGGDGLTTVATPTAGATVTATTAATTIQAGATVTLLTPVATATIVSGSAT